MHALEITGHFMALTHWHVTDSVDDNITRVTRSKMIAGCADDDGCAPERPPTMAWVPLVPSNSLRGRLRRHTLSLLTEALLQRGECLNSTTYQMLSNGGMIGGRDDGRITVGEVIRARKEVFFGLWGGGPRLLPSAAITCDLVPVCAETIAAGKVPAALLGFAAMRSPTEPVRGYDLISVRTFKRNDDMMQLNGTALERLTVLGPDAEHQIAEYQAEQLGFRAARKEAKAEFGEADARTLSDDQRDALKKKDAQNFLQMETVCPGSIWPVDLRLDSYVTPAQIALFCRGLERLVNEQRLGGCSRLGFGQYRARLTISLSGDEIGTIQPSASGRRHVLTFKNASYDTTLEEAFARVSAAELNGFASVAQKAPEECHEPRRKGKVRAEELVVA